VTEAYLLAWWHQNQRFENDALMSVYIGSLVMDNNTEEKTKREERYGICLWCCRGYDKRRSHPWSCRSWSILFYSILFLMHLNPMLIATDILHCTVCKSDQWEMETDYLCRPGFHETLFGQKPICRPYGNSFRFCLSAQTLFRLWQSRNECSSPPSELVSNCQ
jgi:hypothetical protein